MLYIDASRYNNTALKTGVENYSWFLISELVRQAPKDITLISPKKIDLPAPQRIIPFPRLWTQVRLSWEILRNKKIVNLFVPSHLMPVIHPKNTTITIHDAAFKRYPESYGRLSRWYLDWGTRFAVRHAKNIIVPSEITKKDLIHFYQADPTKIHVIPLGYEKIISKSEMRNPKCEINEPYFLFIGRIETKKNIQTLIRAFEIVRQTHPEIKLVLAGKMGRGGEEIIKNYKNQNCVIGLGYISESDKWTLLKNCLCFVFPSLFEGFGIPLLEAMDAGAPIIASRIPSSLEIAKKNALFFDPQDAEELARQMEKILSDPSLRQKLTARYQETLACYSWKKCAEEILKICKG